MCAVVKSYEKLWTWVAGYLILQQIGKETHMILVFVHHGKEVLECVRKRGRKLATCLQLGIHVASTTLLNFIFFFIYFFFLLLTLSLSVFFFNFFFYEQLFFFF